MNVAVVYLRVVKRSDPCFHPEFSYDQSESRFLETYRKFPPTIAHDLIVVDCGAVHDDHLFDSHATHYHVYDGEGYDCGAYQDVILHGFFNYDLVLALNTHAYFWRHLWLERFVKTHETLGPGVYGTCGSFEVHPHVRTPVIAFAPEIMRRYPEKVNTREQCNLFEFGPRNFSLMAMNWGYPIRILGVDSEYYLLDCGQIPNGFRDGDQSNVLIYDRHTDIWRDLDDENKAAYSRSARTPNLNFPPELLLK